MIFKDLNALWVLFHLTNVFLCLQDIKTKKVSLTIFVFLILQILVLFFSNVIQIDFIGITLFFSSICITWLFLKRNIIALSDIIYISLCLIFLEGKWPIFFILIGLSSLIIFTINGRKRNESIPFFPCVYFSFVASHSFF